MWFLVLSEAFSVHMSNFNVRHNTTVSPNACTPTANVVMKTLGVAMALTREKEGVLLQKSVLVN